MSHGPDHLDHERHHRWLAGMIVRGGGYGPLADLLIGLVGGLVGGFLAGVLGMQPVNWAGQILIAALGGALLVWILHQIHPATLDM